MKDFAQLLRAATAGMLLGMLLFAATSHRYVSKREMIAFCEKLERIEVAANEEQRDVAMLNEQFDKVAGYLGAFMLAGDLRVCRENPIVYMTQSEPPPSGFYENSVCR